MNHSHLLSNIVGYTVSLFFILMGLTVLIRKKPMIYSHKWLILIFTVLFLIPTIKSFSYPINMMTIIFPLMILLFIFYFYFIMKGVMVMGADGDDFQKAFVSVLNENNYKFEQTFSSIKIAEPILEISIAFQSWVGGGQIRLRNKENKETFDKIISQLKTKEIKPNLIMPIIYLVFGALLLFMKLRLW